MSAVISVMWLYQCSFHLLFSHHCLCETYTHIYSSNRSSRSSNLFQLVQSMHFLFAFQSILSLCRCTDTIKLHPRRAHNSIHINFGFSTLFWVRSGRLSCNCNKHKTLENTLRPGYQWQTTSHDANRHFCKIRTSLFAFPGKAVTVIVSWIAKNIRRSVRSPPISIISGRQLLPHFALHQTKSKQT